jgi:hypothetical protein
MQRNNQSIPNYRCFACSRPKKFTSAEFQRRFPSPPQGGAQHMAWQRLQGSLLSREKAPRSAEHYVHSPQAQACSSRYVCVAARSPRLGIAWSGLIGCLVTGSKQPTCPASRSSRSHPFTTALLRFTDVDVTTDAAAGSPASRCSRTHHVLPLARDAVGTRRLGGLGLFRRPEPPPFAGAPGAPSARRTARRA